MYASKEESFLNTFKWKILFWLQFPIILRFITGDEILNYFTLICITS